MVPDIGFASCSNDRFVNVPCLNYILSERQVLIDVKRNPCVDFGRRLDTHTLWSYFLRLLPLAATEW